MSSVSNGSTLQNGKWYYVSSSVTFSDRIHTDGEVNIILGDGATVNFQRGIEVGENDTLNIYDQKNGTGKMIAFSERFAYSDDQDEAAIGADKGAGGTMNFYGGIFEATTKRECRGAAIGGGGFGSGGRMIFYAGNYTINAIYGTSTGIGGGYHGRASRCSGEGITISGAGIGGGKGGSNHLVNINGGSVVASSSCYEDSAEMMRSATKYLGHSPMGSKYQRTANAMMVAIGGMIDLFNDEEESGAGIGGGQGGSGSGTLNIGNKLMVNSGSDDTDAQLQKKNSRVSACRNSKYANVEPCTNPHSDYKTINESCHTSSCLYCAADEDAELHEFDASGLTCSLCGYQRVKVSFDPGSGSGVMDGVYLTKGKTYTLPASSFTPPSNQYFSGWRATIGSATDVFVPGASFTLNESVTLTAEYGDTYQLWVGGVQVTEANLDDVLGDGKVSFDPEGCVLNLNGVTSIPNVCDSQRALIYANRMNLTVTGSGDLTTGQMFMNGIYVNTGSLTLDGNFSVSGSQGNGFYASKDLIITGGTITAQVQSYGIRSGRRIYLYDGITRISVNAEQQKALYYDDIFVDPTLIVTEYSPEDALRPNGSFYYDYTKHIVIERGAVITYILNGGAIDGQTYDVKCVIPKGTVLDRPDDPTRDGYAFGGWFMDAGYDTSFDFSRPVNGDITLYAKWTEKPRHTILMSDMTGGYVFAPDEAYEGQEVRIYPHDDLGYDLEYIGCMTDGGAGIGTGGSASDSEGTITINGGTLNARGGNGRAGIGGGCGDNAYAGRVVINGGKVTAKGGLRAAGIGAGYGSHGDVIISGGIVEASGGSFSTTGIGGSGSNVTMTYTDDVSVTSDSYGGAVTLEKPFTDGTNVFEAGEVSDNTYSVSQYADWLLEHKDESEAYTKAAPLVEKMLQYGAYAKAYFSNTTLDDLDDVMIDAPGTAFDLPDGVTFEGAALSLKSETTLSLYFTSKSTLTFSVNGKTVGTVTNGAYQVARIRSIAASELIDSFTVTINGNYSVTYSPMNYCANVLNGGTTDGKLINAVKALYQYSQAANEYFKPYHEGN